MRFAKLKEFSDKAKLNIDEKQFLQFEQFCDALVEKNKVMNLTAIEDMKEIEIKHLIDSVEGCTAINEITDAPFSLIDVGCGGGFPGIPLKIIYPDSQFTLMDSLNKRIGFINEVVNKLQLANITAIAARAEDLARTEVRESFDFAVSRAVARLNVLTEYCLPFVKVGGHCIFYKGSDYEEELKEAETAIELLGGKLKKNILFELPEGGGTRSLIIIEKIKETPEKYPRRAGKPTKSPIK